MMMTEKEQKPHNRNRSNGAAADNNNINQKQPPMLEKEYSDDDSSSNRGQTHTYNNKKTTADRQQPNDEDSTRHESPPSKVREGMDMINQIRYKIGAIVNNENVQFFIVILIAVNAIMMGIGTFDFVNENPTVDEAFEQIDKVFLILFTIELGMQFVFHGIRLFFDGWLVFDLIVIVMSWSFSQVQIIRAFRIFRALRLITRIEVMKNLVLGKYYTRK